MSKYSIDNLYGACRIGDFSHVKKHLISYERKINPVVGNAISIAINNDNIEIVKLILKHIPDLTQYYFKNALTSAINALNVEAVKLLLNSSFCHFKYDLNFISYELDINRTDNNIKNIIARKEILKLLFNNEVFLRYFTLLVSVIDLPNGILTFMFNNVNLDKYENYKHSFIRSLCFSLIEYDDVTLFEEVVKKYKIDIHSNNSSYLNIAMRRNSINIIEYIINNTNSKIQNIDIILHVIKLKNNKYVYNKLLNNNIMLKQLINNCKDNNDWMTDKLLKKLNLKNKQELIKLSTIM